MRKPRGDIRRAPNIFLRSDELVNDNPDFPNILLEIFL